MQNTQVYNKIVPVKAMMKEGEDKGISMWLFEFLGSREKNVQIMIEFMFL